ncbi:hypothetical protein B0H14DRAFT_2885314 [Mycena olivaceomarginata]|nr:hypothetical protein B0H14DRAFT_2885314 [Mycena olivaceomarginata]
MKPIWTASPFFFQAFRSSRRSHMHRHITEVTFTRPMSVHVGEPSTSTSPEPLKKARKPRLSAEQIAAADAAATQLEKEMESPEVLQRALESLSPRVREAFELVAFTGAESLAEICEKMRPEKPMNSQTVGSYILKAFDQTHDFAGEAALFRAIGSDKLTDFVRDADPFRWRAANGYNAFMTNSARVAALSKSDTARKRLVGDVRKGSVSESDIEKEKHRILMGWTKDDIPKLPKAAAVHIVAGEVARHRGMDREHRVVLRKILGRSAELAGKSVDEGIDSEVMALGERVADNRGPSRSEDAQIRLGTRISEWGNGDENERDKKVD